MIECTGVFLMDPFVEQNVSLSLRHLWAASITTTFPSPSEKKSIPRIAQVTSATIIMCVHPRPMIVNVSILVPNVFIMHPLAACKKHSSASGCWRSWGEGGTTDTTDPVSIIYPHAYSRRLCRRGEGIRAPLSFPELRCFRIVIPSAY